MIIASSQFFSNPAQWGTAVLAAVAIVGLLFAGMSWLYKRGADERELTLAIKNHSAATDNLASKVDEIGRSFRLLETRIAEHETRITVSEQGILSNTRDISRLWPSPFSIKNPETTS
jgi:hypothetical protein